MAPAQACRPDPLGRLQPLARRGLGVETRAEGRRVRTQRLRQALEMATRAIADSRQGHLGPTCPAATSSSASASTAMVSGAESTFRVSMSGSCSSWLRMTASGRSCLVITQDEAPAATSSTISLDRSRTSDRGAVVILRLCRTLIKWRRAGNRPTRRAETGRGLARRWTRRRSPRQVSWNQSATPVTHARRGRTPGGSR